MKEASATKKTINEKSEKKKDYYTLVMVCQIIFAAVLFLLYSLFIAGSESKKNELLYYLCEEKFATKEIVASIKDYFSSDGTWEVFGNSVTRENQDEREDEKEDSTTTENNVTDTELTTLNGTGGDDLTIYEAAKNTSFAHIKTTSPAIKPIENGRYTSYFGYRINPITGEFSFHTGLDIAASEGTKIRAAYSGTVTKVGEDGRAGKYIFLTHDDGFVTFYCHCSKIVAQEGAVIRQGETIAIVGTTGWSTGPHLHFEIRKDNIRYNPIYVLENDS